jgi:hypothetical protein
VGLWWVAGPIVGRLATMPVFVLAAQLCPDNVEVRLRPCRAAVGDRSPGGPAAETD